MSKAWGAHCHGVGKYKVEILCGQAWGEGGSLLGLECTNQQSLGDQIKGGNII